MNPMLTKDTLNSFIFVKNIFSTGPTRKCGIIGTTTRHQASVCLLHQQQLNGEWNPIDN